MNVSVNMEIETAAAEAFDADLYWLAFEEEEETPATASVIEEPTTSAVAPVVAESTPFAASSSDGNDPSPEEPIDEAFDAWAEDEFDFADELLSLK